MLIPDGSEKVLAIPDTQLPFHHKEAISFLSAVKEVYKPTQVIHLGDFFDLHALSNYPHDPDGYGAGHELEEAIVEAQKYYELFPKARVLISNHDIRAYKRAYEIGIPKRFLKDYHEWMEFPPGWSMEEKVEIDGVLYIHGEGYSGALASRQMVLHMMQSVVHGHLHSFANIAYHATPKALMFGFNVGCLINSKAYVFAYGTHMKYKPILGCGIIDKGVPHFVPMLLDHNGNWIGRLV